MGPERIMGRSVVDECLVDQSRLADVRDVSLTCVLRAGDQVVEVALDRVLENATHDSKSIVARARNRMPPDVT